MTDSELIKMAEKAGFHAAVIDTKDIPVDGSFRKFCEENRCGKYDANYSCPPACGTPQEVHQRLLEKKKALVLQMTYEIGSYENQKAIQNGRNMLNKSVLALAEALRQLAAPGDVMLFKGSRGMKMELALEQFMKKES